MKILNYLKRKNKIGKIKETWLKFYSKDSGKIKFAKATIYEYFKKCNEENNELIALNYFNKKITYQELLDKIDQVSNSLKTLNVKEKDIISLIMPNTPEAIMCFYAINKIGAIVDMIHPLSAPLEIKRYLNETKSKVVICADIVLPKLKDIINDTFVEKIIEAPINNSMPILPKVGYNILSPKKNTYISSLSWKDFLLLGTHYSQEYTGKMKKHDTAIILHSGGTTGTPKGIMISNYAFNALAQQCAINVKNVKPGDKIVTVLPIFHGFGLGVCIHCPLCLKVEVILMPEFKSNSFYKIIKKNKPQVLAGVPTMWEYMLNSPTYDDLDLSSLKYVISGGDTITNSLENEMNNYLKKHNSNIKISKGYGMTESSAAVTYTYDYANAIGSIGVPMTGNKICICKVNTTEKVEANTEGEICVTGPTLMNGYYNNEEETKKVLKKHKDGNLWLHTGDMGYLSKEGLLYFTQRIKRIFVSSGFNIYPSQIENVIEMHPQVSKCCVISSSHAYKKQVAKAYVVLTTSKLPTLKIKKEINNLCSQNLAKYSLPQEIIFVKALPKTLYGKTNYIELEKNNYNPK